MRMPWLFILGFLWSVAGAQTLGQQSAVHGLLWDVHEMTVGQVKQFANSSTNRAGFKKRAGRGVSLMALRPSMPSQRFTSPSMRPSKSVITSISDYPPMPNGLQPPTWSNANRHRRGSLKASAMPTPTATAPTQVIACTVAQIARAWPPPGASRVGQVTCP
jgi:hypothetical protein